MKKRRIMIGVLLILLGIAAGCFVICDLMRGEGEQAKEKPPVTDVEQKQEEKKPLHSVSGRKFGTQSDNCYFYDDTHVVVTVEARNKFGDAYLDRSLYKYRIKGDRLILKSNGMSFSVPFFYLADGITMDHKEYPLMNEEKNVPEVVGSTFRRGMEQYRFIDRGSVVVTLKEEGKKTTEVWGYDLSEHRIVFTYGTGGARAEHPFGYVEEGIKIGDEVYGKE